RRLELGDAVDVEARPDDRGRLHSPRFIELESVHARREAPALVLVALLDAADVELDREVVPADEAESGLLDRQRAQPLDAALGELHVDELPGALHLGDRLLLREERRLLRRGLLGASRPRTLQGRETGEEGDREKESRNPMHGRVPDVDVFYREPPV